MVLIDGGPEGYQIFHVEKEKNMDNSEITADWARKTAETQMSIEAEEQLNTCLEEIKKAVSENKMSVNVYIYAKQVCLNELTKRGFKAQSYDDQREGQWTTISW